jgi:hypothetical protein
LNQLIQTIKILSEADLKQINSLIDADKGAFQHSTVWSEDGSFSHNIRNDVRTSSGLTVHANSKLEGLLHRAMERGLQKYRNRVKRLNTTFQYWPIPGSHGTFFGREPIQVLQYKPGQKYVFHHDQGNCQNQPEYFRTLSTVLYLNDGFEGGEIGRASCRERV